MFKQNFRSSAFSPNRILVRQLLDFFKNVSRILFPTLCYTTQWNPNLLLSDTVRKSALRAGYVFQVQTTNLLCSLPLNQVQLFIFILFYCEFHNFLHYYLYPLNPYHSQRQLPGTCAPLPPIKLLTLI